VTREQVKTVRKLTKELLNKDEAEALNVAMKRSLTSPAPEKPAHQTNTIKEELAYFADEPLINLPPTIPTYHAPFLNPSPSFFEGLLFDEESGPDSSSDEEGDSNEEEEESSSSSEEEDSSEDHADDEESAAEVQPKKEAFEDDPEDSDIDVDVVEVDVTTPMSLSLLNQNQSRKRKHRYIEEEDEDEFEFELELVSPIPPAPKPKVERLEERAPPPTPTPTRTRKAARPLPSSPLSSPSYHSRSPSPDTCESKPASPSLLTEKPVPSTPTPKAVSLASSPLACRSPSNTPASSTPKPTPRKSARNTEIKITDPPHQPVTPSGGEGRKGRPKKKEADPAGLPPRKSSPLHSATPKPLPSSYHPKTTVRTISDTKKIPAPSKRAWAKEEDSDAEIDIEGF